VKELDVRIKVENSETELAKIFNYMIENRITPLSINVYKPSLDQVFIEYTGKTIKEAEGGEDVRKNMMNMRRMRA
jgi:ABC-2 type transport system ATP-binding protein